MKTIAAPSERWTDEKLLAVPEGEFWQLIDGELLKMSPVGGEHGLVCARLLVEIGIFLRANPLGELFDFSTGFRLDSENCFAADIAFVTKERLPILMLEPHGFLQGAPDLAVEVISPSNRLRQIEQKISTFFESGTKLAWVVIPDKKQVRLYTGRLKCEVLNETDTLNGGAVLPGFALSIKEIFNYPRVRH